MSSSKDKIINGKYISLEVDQSFLVDFEEREESPVVTNLNEYLVQLTSSGSCLVVINNFRSVNIRDSTIPIILRRPVPLLLRVPIWQIEQTLLGVSSASNLNQSIPSNNHTPINCTLSKYWMGLGVRREFEDTCVSLNIREFTFRIKSFTCMMHIGLFPNRHFIQYKSLYPRFLKLPPNPLVIPDVTSVLHCIITTIPATTFSHSQKEAQRSLQTWVKSIISPPYTLAYKSQRLSQDMLMIAQVNNISRRSHLTEYTSRISAVYALRVCQTCWDTNSDKFGVVVRVRLSHNVNVCDMKKLGFPSVNEKLVWTFVTYDGIESLLNHVYRLVDGCNGEYQPEKLLERIDKVPDLFGKVAVAHADVWMSLLKNSTVFRMRSFGMHADCDQIGALHYFDHNFKISVTLNPYVSRSYIFRYLVPDKMNTLRFIGSGRKGSSKLPFQEFTNVFHTKMWLCIILSCVFVPIFLKLLLKESTYGSNVLSMLTLLLEQGDPFPSKITYTFRIRIILGFLLLMGIVLSNGYKSTNVYNIVTPRKPILYKYMQELLQDNITVYTRTASRKIDVLLSEVDVLMENYANLMQESGGLNLTDETMQRSSLGAVARLSPEVVNTFENMVRLAVGPEFHWRMYERITYDCYEKLKTVEEVMLREHLAYGKKTALILPQHKCWEFLREIKQNLSFGNIFVGDETYSELHWKFRLSGWVPPRVISKVNNIYETGIWQWWIQVFNRTSTYLKNNDRDQVQAPSLRGNIPVVFVLWGFGLALAFSILLIEFRKHFSFKVVSMFMYFIWIHVISSKSTLKHAPTLSLITNFLYTLAKKVRNSDNLQ